MNELETKRSEARKKMARLIELGDSITDEQAEQLLALKSEAKRYDALIAGQEEAAKEEADREAAHQRELAEAVAKARNEEAAKYRRLPYGEAPYQTKYSDTSKFDDLSAAETALVIDVLNSQNRQVSGGAFKALSLKIAELKDRENTEESHKFTRYVQNHFASSTGIKADMQSVEAAVKAATDPMYTGGSGIGSDWVGTAYSSELWQVIRAANVVVNRIPTETVPDGYSSLYWPLESSDPTWYTVAEATASDSTLKVPAATITASQFATTNKQITLAKIGARSLYTGELTEDSLIAFAPEMRRKLEVSGAEILEHLFIDGDVETSANKNINLIDSTPSAGTIYLAFDGFRKNALVTNTANSRTASGGFVISDFKDTLKLMGTAGLNGANPNAVAFILDYNTMWAALDLPELKTRDVFTQATIENGFLTRIYNTQVLYSLQMHRNSNASGYERKVNTSGKVSNTGSNNTTGAILAVRFDQWKTAFKRRMTMETTRIANADAWEIVALARLGLANRDTEASAVTYNVAV